VKQENPVGKIILDGDKLGIVVNEIKVGTMTENSLFSWDVNYEIKYFNGETCVMTRTSFYRLVLLRRIEILRDAE
jgi:hypothetical protein|tara:strand:+ start:342 stop:566 length:225 start_codon:yes stop_codon:yes gene_type:complete